MTTTTMTMLMSRMHYHGLLRRLGLQLLLRPPLIVFVLVVVVLAGPPWTIAAKSVSSFVFSSSSSASPSSSHSYYSSTKWVGRRSSRSCSSSSREPTRKPCTAMVIKRTSQRIVFTNRMRTILVPPFTSSKRMIRVWSSNQRENDVAKAALTTTLGEEGGTGGDGVLLGGVDISIEYCSACRWMLRASWIAMELLTTFVKDDRLLSVTLIPTGGGGMYEEEGGIFRVVAASTDRNTDNEHETGNAKNNTVLWDRKMTGRFPESKEVKQLVRDIVNPTKDLGHSDVVVGGGVSSSDVGNAVHETEAKEEEEEEEVSVVVDDCIECKEREANEKKEEGQVHEYEEELSSRRSTQPEQQQSIIATSGSSSPFPMSSSISTNQTRNRVTIEYSIGDGSSIDSPDNGLYRAAYYANELLSMVYERNAWWKRKQQRCLENDDVDGNNDNDMPIAVDSVTLIPNRFDRGLLVSFIESRTVDIVLYSSTLLAWSFNVLTSMVVCIGKNKENEAEQS